MVSRTGKPSGYLKKCCIAVIGGLGKDAKISDVEKWIVNNGGTYSSKVNKNTTHLVCTLQTYEKDNHTLPKQHANHKNLHIVGWSWLEDTLKAKRIKPVKQYLHPRNWAGNIDKKAVRRRAMLTGKPMDEVDTVQIENPSKAHIKDAKADKDKEVSDKTIHNKRNLETSAKEERAPFRLSTFVDEVGFIWEVNLKGSELVNPEKGDYYLSILVTNGDPQYYRAQYLHSTGNDKPVRHTVSVGNSLSIVRTEFEIFYKTKTGKKWSDYYAELLTTARSTRQDSDHTDDVFHDARSEATTSTGS